MFEALEKPLNDAIMQARVLKLSQRAYEKAINDYTFAVENANPLPEATFWQITGAYRSLILDAIGCQRPEPPKWAADELFRCATFEGTSSWWVDRLPHMHVASFFDTMNYATIYGRYKRGCYKLVDQMEQVSRQCGKGDDGFGDMIDGLPLLGPKFYRRLEQQRFYNYKHFKQIIRKHVSDFVDELGENYKHAADKIKKRFAHMIIDGENYFHMMLEDAAKEWFPTFYKEQEKETATYGCAGD